jgi:hypothetical protein
MKMRACTKCGITKPLETGFYKHSFAQGGYQTKCIECAKADVRANRAARLEYYRAYDRQRAKSPHRVEARLEYAKANPKTRPESDPQKKIARSTLGNALRDGKIVRPPECEVCSIPCTPHGHHDDYSKPLDVIWCCTACHALIHAYWRAQERFAA